MTQDKNTRAFDLAIDYKVDYKEEPELGIDYAYAELTKSYIEFAITACYRDGLSSQFRRLYTTIEDKLVSALATKTFVVSFTEGEFNFIKSAFADEKTKFVPQVSRYIVALEDALLECK